PGRYALWCTTALRAIAKVLQEQGGVAAVVIHVNSEPGGPEVAPAPVDVLAPQMLPNLGSAQVALPVSPARLHIGAVFPVAVVPQAVPVPVLARHQKVVELLGGDGFRPGMIVPGLVVAVQRDAALRAEWLGHEILWAEVGHGLRPKERLAAVAHPGLV